MPDYTNICVVIHEPKIITVTLNEDQLLLLEQICDMVSDDDEDTPCGEFAAALHEEIYSEIEASRKAAS